MATGPCNYNAVIWNGRGFSPAQREKPNTMAPVAGTLWGRELEFGKRHTVPAFVAGFGFMRAWALTFLSDSGVTPPLSLPLSSDMFLVFAPLIILTMVAVVASAMKWGEAWVLSPRAIVLSALVLTGGTCLLMSSKASASVAAEAVCALGFGAFLLQWGVVSSRIPVERLTLSLCLGFTCAGLICFLLRLLPVPIANAFFVAFVPLSAVMLYWGAFHGKQTTKNDASENAADNACSPGRGCGAQANPDGRAGKLPRNTGTLARLFVAMFLMELVARSSLMLSGEFFTSVLSYPSSSFEFARLCGTVLASALLIVVAKCSKEPLRTLYLVVPALLVCSCLFLLFENWGIPFVTYAIAFAAGAWLETVFWIFFSHSHQSLGFPAIAVWGCGRIAFWLSTFVGLLFWSYQAHIAGGIVENESATITLTLVMALLSMVVYLFVLPERTVKSLGIISNGESATDSYRSIDRVSLDIAGEFHLSKRETEVFCLLAKGRDTAYIQEKLFISSGTVCSHRDRIYRKLDIHSKQELLDLVESRLDGTR